MTKHKYLYVFILFLIACGGGDVSSDLQPNTAPKLIGLTDYVIDENTSTVATIKATDPDGDNVTYSISGVDSSFINCTLFRSINFSNTSKL
jgi:hypothetical protein